MDSDICKVHQSLTGESGEIPHSGAWGVRNWGMGGKKLPTKGAAIGRKGKSKCKSGAKRLSRLRDYAVSQKKSSLRSSFGKEKEGTLLLRREAANLGKTF